MPQKLGRYEIVEEIGKGAMGVVYLARDPLIGRLVALKTFRVGFSARDDEVAQFRSRFVREAQSAGILSHPNIVTVHDVVDEGAGNMCFIAMEYVKGTNLKQLLQRPDPFPLGFVVEILAQVAEGLDYAHSRGVVHRDIKPANILITPENRVKITDFGIARIDSSNLTMEGQLLGTPNYMAPEQIQGREVDHRADIFSLGVVFYELLTRRKPFQGENLTAVTHKIVYDSFTPPEEIVRDLPRAFTEILGRCLEKDPNRRYPRASEIARELRAVLQAQQTLDDTVATQEVEPLLEEAPAAQAPPVESPAPAAAVTTPPTAEEMAPTRLVARPPLPAAPPAAAGSPSAPPNAPVAAGERIEENAPTRLVARPPVPPEPRSRTGASPPTRRPEGVSVLPPAPSLPPLAPAPAPSSVAATALSAVPRGSDRPLAPPPAAAASSPGATAPPARSRRLVAIGIAAVAAFALAAVAAIVFRTGDETSAVAEQPAPAPSMEQQSRVTAATAIAEARSQLAQGFLDAALQAVARAELAEPQSQETVALREEIAARKLEIAEAELHARTEQGLRAARYAYAERRYSEAISSAKGVLALASANEEAKRILAESERALRRLRERQEALEDAQRQAEANAAAPAPVVDVPLPAAAAKDTQVRIDFASDRSEGVLTVYAADRQILREPFRFVRRTGFLSREKVSGTIEANRRLPPGAVTIRVYVALPGEATRAIALEAELEAGTTRVLQIRVDSDGNATAALR